MPDTTNRPTPEQIADDAALDEYRQVRRQFLEELADVGYVVTHRADTPIRTRESDPGWEVLERMAWNSCHAHIFGSDDA